MLFVGFSGKGNLTMGPHGNNLPKENSMVPAGIFGNNACIDERECIIEHWGASSSSMITRTTEMLIAFLRRAGEAAREMLLFTRQDVDYEGPARAQGSKHMTLQIDTN